MKNIYLIFISFIFIGCGTVKDGHNKHVQTNEINLKERISHQPPNEIRLSKMNNLLSTLGVLHDKNSVTDSHCGDIDCFFIIEYHNKKSVDLGKKATSTEFRRSELGKHLISTRRIKDNLYIIFIIEHVDSGPGLE